MRVALPIPRRSCIVSGALGELPADVATAIDDWLLWILSSAYALFTAVYFVPAYAQYRKVAANTDESPIKIAGRDGRELSFYKFEEGKNVFV